MWHEPTSDEAGEEEEEEEEAIGGNLIKSGLQGSWNLTTVLVLAVTVVVDVGTERQEHALETRDGLY